MINENLWILANEFPSSFESIVRKIVRLLFHVVAHLYAAHFKEVVMLGLHAHLNLTFAHLTALHHRFALIEPKVSPHCHILLPKSLCPDDRIL